MAFTFDAKSQSSATSTGLTLSHTCTGASLLVVCLAIRGDTTRSVTYNGIAMTEAVNTVFAGDPERACIFYLVNPSAGANNIVVSLGTSIEHWVSGSSYASGATPSLDQTGTNSGNSGNPSVTVSGSTSGALGVDLAPTESNSSPPYSSAGGDQTVLHNVGSGSFGAGTSYEIGVSDPETFNWTFTGAADTWEHVVATFKEGAAAVAGLWVPKPLLVFLNRGRKIFAPNFHGLPVPVAPAVTAISESPTPGGAVADGFGPTVTVPVSQGGAVAAGTSPTARVSVTIGGAVADGFGPTARVSVTQGGAVAGGNSPTATSTVTQGGATAAGFGPSPARVAITIGGAIAGGFSPTDGSAVQETPTPGGAIAGGNGPTAQVSVTQGGAVAAGTSPSNVRVTLTIGGALAGGTAPVPSPAVTIGGATAAGFGPSPARVTLTIGGATAGGYAPFVPGSQVPASITAAQWDRFDVTVTASTQKDLAIAQNGRQSVEGAIADKAGVTGSGGSKAGVT